MTHRTAQQRARARNATPLGRKPAQLAPSWPVVPVVCAGDGCGHPRLGHRGRAEMDRLGLTASCVIAACGCTAYVEAP